MRTLFKIVLIGIVAILGYNYFYGDQREQQQAEQIVDKIKDLGADIKGLLVNEKEKYDEGKYDQAITKIGDLIGSLKDKISSIDLSKLENKQEELKEAAEKLKEKSKTSDQDNIEEIEAEMKRLIEELSKSAEQISVQKSN